MKLNIFKSQHALNDKLAQHVIAIAKSAIAEKGRFDFVLTGGSSPKALYKLLSTTYKDQIEWSKTYFFFGDERTVVPFENDYNGLMAKESLFDNLALNEDQIFYVNTRLSPAEAAAEYKRRLDQHFAAQPIVFDLILLGMGDDAHTASIFPQTDLVNNAEATVASVWVEKLNTHRVSLTAPLINQAKNGAEVIEKIKLLADIDIEIIEGQREASIIYSNHIEDKLAIDKSYLYIDVGGGSTELSVFVNRKLTASKSFNIGTIRMLDNQDKQETWDEMKEWTRQHTKYLKNLAGIGTGGNINKLFRMSGEKDDNPLSLLKLTKMHAQLNGYSLEERIRILKLNADRADVIIPACVIYLTLMKWAGVKQIYVPKVGMVDGIINLLIEENL